MQSYLDLLIETIESIDESQRDEFVLDEIRTLQRQIAEKQNALNMLIDKYVIIKK